MTNHTNHIDTDLLEEAVENLQAALEAIQASGLGNDPAFRAYHLSQLEGAEGGWLGGPFLIDAVRAAIEARADECQECGGYTGSDFDILQDSDECECDAG